MNKLKVFVALLITLQFAACDDLTNALKGLEKLDLTTINDDNKKLDFNNDGKISFWELKKFYSDFGLVMEMKEEEFLSKDTDKDGYLSFDEMVFTNSINMG
jgi:hypothetical protein